MNSSEIKSKIAELDREEAELNAKSLSLATPPDEFTRLAGQAMRIKRDRHVLQGQLTEALTVEAEAAHGQEIERYKRDVQAFQELSNHRVEVETRLLETLNDYFCLFDDLEDTRAVLTANAQNLVERGQLLQQGGCPAQGTALASFELDRNLQPTWSIPARTMDENPKKFFSLFADFRQKLKAARRPEKRNTPFRIHAFWVNGAQWSQIVSELAEIDK